MINIARQERLGVAETFREAKKLLWDGESKLDYNKKIKICPAVRITEHPCSDFAESVIREGIAGHCCVESWLRYKLNVPEKHLTVKNIQQYRHRWLDALIEEFSN